MNNFDFIVIILFIFVLAIIIILNIYSPSFNNYKKNVDGFQNLSVNNIYGNNEQPYSTISTNKLYFDSYSNPTSKNSLEDSMNRIKYSTDDSVEYGDFICIKKDLVNQHSMPKKEEQILNSTVPPSSLTTTCPNKSLNELHKTGDKYYEKLNCGQTLSNIQGDMNGIDPAEFYKKNFKPRTAILNDERFNGYNYNQSINIGKPNDVGRIPLYKTNDYPNGANFYTN